MSRGFAEFTRGNWVVVQVLVAEKIGLHTPIARAFSVWHVAFILYRQPERVVIFGACVKSVLTDMLNHKGMVAKQLVDGVLRYAFKYIWCAGFELLIKCILGKV